MRNQLKNYTNQLLEKIFSRFKDNTWGADLADMQSISKFIKGFRFFLCVIDIFSKDAWVVPLKDKKGVTITNAFQKILKQADLRKANKIWVDKGSEFYNNFLKKWLKDNNIIILKCILRENLLLLKDLSEL